MPHYYPEDTSADNIRNIINTNVCAECGRRLYAYMDNDNKPYIACGVPTHKGIAREYIPSLIEQNNYEGGIRRMVEQEKEQGIEAGTQLAKYQTVTSLTQTDAMEIMKVIWPKAPLEEKKAAAILCAGYNLNPLMGHVFLIKFNKKKNGQVIGEEWVRVLGIKAKRLISSRQGAIMYQDMSPRFMTDDEQMKVWGKVDSNNICFVTWLKDAKTGAEAYGYGKWPKASEPYGTDKGNTKENMAGIRSESQALDRLRPGEMPSGVEVMDEQYLDKPTIEVSTVDVIEPTDKPTPDDLKILFAAAFDNGWEIDQVKAVMIRLYTKAQSTDLSRAEYSDLLKRLQAGPPKPAQEELPF